MPAPTPPRFTVARAARGWRVLDNDRGEWVGPAWTTRAEALARCRLLNLVGS